MSKSLGIPVFDADNHLYETREALTKFLPDRYKSVVDYVDVRGRTKIVVKRSHQRVHPQPDVRHRCPPGAQEDYYRHGNPEGRAAVDIYGEPSAPSRRSGSPRRAWS